ncbi:MAG: prolyl oligopeptidase family serine peptidase [Acidimicrobiia bacterium]|nr:prolyl oligopeptidase family serine peptidase [Acidimicrobiia bacterium]
MHTAPYGSWASPITPASVIAASVRYGDSIEIDGDDVYWVENRPSEGGRSAIVRCAADGTRSEPAPATFNARTRVHEYGGGAYGVHQGTVYASSFEDQRIYRFAPGAEPIPITPEPGIPAGLRYADFAFGDGLLVAVRERHRTDGEPVNELVRMPLDGSAEPEVVASGHDFFAAPRISPDGVTLAYLAWDHPNMPWNGTTLWTVDLGGTPSWVAGGPRESIIQPEWSPAGVLHFASDRTGWWNLYRLAPTGEEPVFEIGGDIGACPWVFRYRRFGFLADGRILAVATTPNGPLMLVVDGPGSIRHLTPPGTWLPAWMAVAGDSAVMVAGAADRFPEVVRVSAATGLTETLAPAPDSGVDTAYLSIPETITFDTPDGPAYAHHYPPRNPDYRAPKGETPPLLVFSHGGPTGAARTSLDLAVQYWTSRGIAVVDVDYGGSSGYGRDYWERLEGTWGIVDVRDCALAAQHLVAEGKADGARLAIRGGSAGGYTTLAVLAFRDDFAAGASHYGVADLGLMTEHTHKFESRYLDWLVGPYPEMRAVYEERSPINHADQMTCPIILFQGLDDRVVPPEQAIVMADALRAGGIPVAHIEYEGEGHGFRKAENQIRTLEAELSFYGQVLGFEPAGVPKVPIEGL